MVLASKAKELFNIEIKQFPKAKALSNKCARVYAGYPDWVDEDDHIKTVNFAKSIASEVARLTMLGTSVKIKGGARGKYLQKAIDQNYTNFRDWVEIANVYGTIIIKPNGADIDMYNPSEFVITDTYQGKIWGAIFMDQQQSPDGKTWYTKLEYNRFEDDQYIITNKCFKGTSRADYKESCDIKETPWSDVSEETVLENVDQPLFGVLSTPVVNNVEMESAIGLPIFAGCLEELRDLDVAYSRYVHEIDQSKRTVLLDSDRLFTDGGTLRDKSTRIGSLDHARANMGLPDYVKAIEGTGEGNIYNEINPTLNTAVRVAGINQLLSQIGYKIGFSNGYFVFDQNQGIQTATGVEASQQRTIQFIKDCRDKMEQCIKDVVEATSKLADVTGATPAEEYELALNFGDITYNEEEDRLRWYSYVSAGKMAFWRYLVKFEGMTEEEAKEIEDEMKPQASDLFGGAANGRI